jgi:hypothetical protein
MKDRSLHKQKWAWQGVKKERVLKERIAAGEFIWETNYSNWNNFFHKLK